MPTDRTIPGVIARLQQRQERLADATGFFREHAREYRALAQRIVRQVGRVLRPTRTDIEEWETFLEVLVARTVSQLVTAGAGGEPGLDIELRVAADPQAQEGDYVVGEQGITYNQVREWVEAGLLGEEGGKNIDERDRNEGADAITQRVWKVLNDPAGKMSGASIRAYLEGRQDTPYGKLLSQMLKAWLDQMLPVIRRDWRQWVRRQIKG